MKKIGMKINFLLVAVLFVVALTIGCKKEEDSDPNIVFKTYSGVSLTNTTSASTPDQQKEFDVDANGVNDFLIQADFDQAGGDTTLTQIEIRSLTMENYVISENYNFPGTTFFAEKLKALSNGEKIRAGLRSSEYGFAVLTAKEGSDVLADFGFTDGADKLIGVSFLQGTNRHFGWLKINVSADLKTLTVKEGAYHKTANTEIGAGDK